MRLTLAEFIAAFSRGAGAIGWPGYDGTVRLHAGSSGGMDSYDVERRLPAGFCERPHWADGRYRVVWVSEAERATVTYCEGDLDMVTCADVAGFAAWLAHQEQVYGRG